MGEGLRVWTDNPSLKLHPLTGGSIPTIAITIESKIKLKSFNKKKMNRIYNIILETNFFINTQKIKIY